MKHLKKIILSFFIIAMVSFVAVPPQKAHAQLFTFDPQNLLDMIKEYGLDAIPYNIAGMMAQQMTQKLTNWANSGFDGNPFYIDDVGGFFRDIARDQYEFVVQDALSGNNPYIRDIVRIDFNAVGGSGGGRQGLARLQNTLSNADIDWDNAWRNLSAGSSGSGQSVSSWDLLTQMHSGDANFIGAGLELAAQRSQRELEEAEAKTLELMGANFLSDQTCLRTNIQTRYANTQFAGGGHTGPGSSFSAEDFSPGMTLTTVDDVPIQVECIGTMTDTPSDVISTQLTRAISEPLERTKLPNEFSELIAASFSQLVTGFIDAGARSITSNAGIPNLMDISPAGAIDTILGEADSLLQSGVNEFNNQFGQVANQLPGNTIDWANQPFISIDLIQELEGTFLIDEDASSEGNIVYQTNSNNEPIALRPGAISLMEQELAVVSQIQQIIHDAQQNLYLLDRCLPGPGGPGDAWVDRLEEALERNSAYKRAQIRKNRDSNKGDRFAAAVDQVELVINIRKQDVEFARRNHDLNFRGLPDNLDFPNLNELILNLDQYDLLIQLSDRLTQDRARLSQGLQNLYQLRSEYTSLSNQLSPENNTQEEEQEIQRDLAQLRHRYTQLVNVSTEQTLSQRKNSLIEVQTLITETGQAVRNCINMVAAKTFNVMDAMDHGTERDEHLEWLGQYFRTQNISQYNTLTQIFPDFSYPVPQSRITNLINNYSGQQGLYCISHEIVRAYGNDFPQTSDLYPSFWTNHVPGGLNDIRSIIINDEERDSAPNSNRFGYWTPWNSGTFTCESYYHSSVNDWTQRRNQ